MKSTLRAGLTAIVAVFILSSFGVTETRAQGILNEILKRMDTHYKALKSLQADVTREEYNPQLDSRDITSGNLSLLPGKGKDLALRLEWTKPKNEIISIVKGQYVAYIPGINRAYTGTSESKTLNDKGGSALKVMSMSKEEIKSNYDVIYLGQENISGGISTWHLKLTPKQKSNYKFAELWVDTNGMPLQAKITQLNDDTDAILLTNLKKNVAINGSIFKVALQKKTEIIKS